MGVLLFFIIPPRYNLTALISQGSMQETKTPPRSSRIQGHRCLQNQLESLEAYSGLKLQEGPSEPGRSTLPGKLLPLPQSGRVGLLDISTDDWVYEEVITIPTHRSGNYDQDVAAATL